jgi:hypothetical protein
MFMDVFNIDHGFSSWCWYVHPYSNRYHVPLEFEWHFGTGRTTLAVQGQL